MGWAQEIQLVHKVSTALIAGRCGERLNTSLQAMRAGTS